MAITITEQQLKALEPYAYENYITELMAHCDEKFPHLRKTMGEEKLRQTIQQCIEKAKQSGFTQRGPIWFYAEMFIIFGWEFETDPQYPWIKETLQRNQHLSQLDSSSELFNATHLYLNNIYGENNKHLISVANKLEQLTLDNIHINKNRFIQDMLVILHDIYPQKCRFTEKESLTKLIEKGIQKSNVDYQFEQPNHIALIIILMFSFGHEFDHNPFYGWAAIEKSNQYKEGTLMTNHQEKVARKLQNRAKIWLSAAMKN